MDRSIYYNDSIVDASDVAISPTSAGAIYGWGVFTTLRIYRGAVFAFDRHWERLSRHAERAHLPITMSFDEAKRALNGLVAANSIFNGRARITLLKGETGAWRTGQERGADLLMFTSPEPARSPREVALTVSPYRLLSHGPLAGVKRTAMLENLLAFDEARSRGFTEAVILNERGEIVSATAANIFWVEGKEVLTPSPATGCVAGVTRALVHEIAQRVRLHPVEGGFPLQRLLDASEVFLTSTTREISPASSFDIKQYDTKKAAVTRLINREFQKLVRDAKID